MFTATGPRATPAPATSRARAPQPGCPPVHFTSTDSQAGLPADYTFVSGDNGVHSFSVTLKTAGAQSITATDKTTATITGTESGITVAAAAASKFVVSGFPISSTAGVAGT